MRTTRTTRTTRQRQVILQELSGVTSHPTADELYGMVRRRLPRISLGTVYRNLELLAEQGLIQKIQLPGAQKRFDATVDNHYHARCIKCGRVDDLDHQPIPSVEEELSDVTDYEVLGHRLEIVGICPSCQERSP